jgi:hypothetical protein
MYAASSHSLDGGDVLSKHENNLSAVNTSLPPHRRRWKTDESTCLETSIKPK